MSEKKRRKWTANEKLRIVLTCLQPAEPPKPVQPYEALPDEEVAYLGTSTVYRILKEAKLVCPWRRRSKRRREEDEKASRPNQIWATDIKYVWVGGRDPLPNCAGLPDPVPGR